MFADDLRKAMQGGGRATICRLLQAIPADRWQCSPGFAEVWYGGVHIVVQPLGGGINTYDSLSVNVRFPDGEPEFAGKCLADELRLPNYIPRSERPSGGDA